MLRYTLLLHCSMAYAEEVGTATSFLNQVLHLGPAVDQRGGARRTAIPEASQSVLQNAAAPAKRRVNPDGAVARPPLILAFFLRWCVHVRQKVRKERRPMQGVPRQSGKRGGKCKAYHRQMLCATGDTGCSECWG